MRLLFISPKNVYATGRILDEAGKLGITITRIDGNEPADPKEFDGLYVRMAFPYLNEVFTLAKKFKSAGKLVVDEIIAEIGPDTNKFDDVRKCEDYGILIPKTLAAEEYGKLPFPLVIKTKYGFGKREVFLVKSENSLRSYALMYESGVLFAQEFIKADFEYKIICVGYKATPQVIRYKILPSGFGIDPENFEVLNAGNLREAVGIAENASRVLSRELAKVDILEKDGKLYLLEVNRSPGFSSYEKITGFNVAGEFTNYIRQKYEKML